jgi:hypothetical protein
MSMTCIGAPISHVVPGQHNGGSCSIRPQAKAMQDVVAFPQGCVLAYQINEVGAMRPSAASRSII